MLLGVGDHQCQLFWVAQQFQRAGTEQVHGGFETRDEQEPGSGHYLAVGQVIPVHFAGGQRRQEVITR